MGELLGQIISALRMIFGVFWTGVSVVRWYRSPEGQELMAQLA